MKKQKHLSPARGVSCPSLGMMVWREVPAHVQYDMMMVFAFSESFDPDCSAVMGTASGGQCGVNTGQTGDASRRAKR